VRFEDGRTTIAVQSSCVLRFVVLAFIGPVNIVGLGNLQNSNVRFIVQGVLAYRVWGCESHDHMTMALKISWQKI
jgi:hypothetical protein